MAPKYILACDERGVTLWPSARRAYVFGGYITEESERPCLAAAWNEIKKTLCGDPRHELKWSHFFPGRHQLPETNPLVSADPVEWRRQALWALRTLFEGARFFPVATIVLKDRASDGLFRVKSSGKCLLDTDLIWPCTLAQFAFHLQQHGNARGELWFDRLGSRAEERRRQANWARLRSMPLPTPGMDDWRVLRERIDLEIRFLDSKREPVVQLADFVSGVVWAAADGDESFIRELLDGYAPGRRRTHGIVLIE